MNKILWPSFLIIKKLKLFNSKSSYLDDCTCVYINSWFFGDFRCGVSLVIVIRLIYKYGNR